MTTQHTPGPWQINHRAPDQICDADGEVRGCAPIAIMCGPISERKANAALIVRAPEMVAEIARLQAQVDGLRSGLDVWSATAGRAQARATDLQAQVDALADVAEKYLEWVKPMIKDPGMVVIEGAAIAALSAVGR